MSNWWRHLFPREIPSDWQKISDFSDFKSLTSGFCAERKILFFLWYFGLSILQFGLQILILPLHTASPTLDPRSINICGFKTWWTADLRRKLSPTKAIPQNERRNIYQQYTMSYPKFKQNIWVKSHKIGRPKKIMLRSLVNELPEKSSAMIHTLLSLTWLRQITTFNM